MMTKNMKALFFAVSVLLISTLNVLASETDTEAQGRSAQRQAPGLVFGQLVDGQTDESLMFASIVLHNMADSTMTGGAISDETGRFVIDNVPFGSYYLAVSYVGYPRQTLNGISIRPDNVAHDAGIVRIVPDASLLSEVTVTATRELMEVGLDRRVFNVAQELTSVGGTALDIMQNIPGVAVDFDGNVNLRGSNNVTILIDGRPSSLLGMSGSEALQQLPSDMIERVEVITNPSVRYDADGTSGIINIVLKKERRQGYNGMLTTNVGSNGRYSGSVNMNYFVGKLNVFGNYSGNVSSTDGFGSNFSSSFLADTTYMDQNMLFENDMNTHNLTLGVDYNMNDYNTFTVSFGLNNRDRNGLSQIDYYALDRTFDISDVFIRASENSMDNSGYQVNFSHRRTYPQRFREWTTDFTFSSRSMLNTEENRQYTHPDFGTGLESVLQNTASEGNNHMFRFRTDYVYPMGENTKLEAGVQAYIREDGSDFAFFDFDHQQQFWSNNEGLSNNFVYNEQILSAYGIYSTIVGNYSLMGGLRIENTNVQADQRTTQQKFNDDYFSFFPSFHVRRNMANNQSIQLSYGRRINRPNQRNVNPFISYTDPYNLSFGNPGLQPEFTNSLELGFARYGRTTTINPSVFYRHTTGMVTRFRTMDEQGIAYTTFENLNTGISYGAEMVVSHRIADFWRANGTVSYFRRTVEGSNPQMQLRNDSYSWSARLMNNFTLPRGFTAQLSGFYRSPMVMIQGEMKAMYSADMAVRKSVMNNNGTITLRLSDVFNTQRFQMYNYGDNFTLDLERRRNSRMVFLGFSYRINDFDRRSQRRDRDTDDFGGDMDFGGFDL